MTGNIYSNATQKTPNGLADLYDITRRKILGKFPDIAQLLLEEAQTKDKSSKRF